MLRLVLDEHDLVLTDWIIGELRAVALRKQPDLLPALEDFLTRIDPEIAPPGTLDTSLAPSATGEAVSALMGLGIAEVNARRVVEQAALRLGDEATVQALIKAGLQELGR